MTTRRAVALAVVLVVALLGAAYAQVLVTALPVDPTSLDPQRAIEGYSFMVTNQVYDTLLRLGDDGAIEPGLASAWSRPEPSVLRLELRPGVRFHDGVPLDAAAVAASLRRLTDPATGARGAFLLASVESIEVIDEHTLDLLTHTPFVPLLANLTFPATAIVPPGAGAELGRAPIGTGPFRFVAWRDGDTIELVADREYWGGEPALAGIEYRVMPERAAQLIAFRAGALHLIHDLPPDAYHALRDEPDIELVSYPSDRTSYLFFNLQDPLLVDQDVRRAIAHGIDTTLLTEALFRGLALPPGGPLAPLVRYALQEPDPYPVDADRARTLLREAGADGARLVLSLASDGDLDSVAQYLQAALSDIGLRIDLLRLEFPAHHAYVTSGESQLSVGFWGSDTLDPDFMLSAALTSREIGSNNSSAYADPDFDALLERGAATDDPTAREASYHAAQRLVLRDLPLLPLYHHVGTYAKRGGLAGERIVASSFQLDLRGARLGPGGAGAPGR